MSMVVGINLDGYVLIAADRREVLMMDGAVVSIVSDEIEKIVTWGGGIVTGTGYVALLDQLKNGLKNKEITHTNEILQMAHNISNSSSISFLEDWKASTNWIFSYVTEVDSSRECRVAILRCSDPTAPLSMLHEMTSTILTNIPNLDEKIAELNSKLKSLKEIGGLERNINYHKKILKDFFKYVSKRNTTVSKTFDVFIQTRDGRIRKI